MNNATIKDIIKEMTKLCQDCKHATQAVTNNTITAQCSFDPIECIKEVSPSDLRKIGLAFLCESCEDQIVTNLDVKDEDDNPYWCEECRKNERSSNRLSYIP